MPGIDERCAVRNQTAVPSSTTISAVMMRRSRRAAASSRCAKVRRSLTSRGPARSRRGMTESHARWRVHKFGGSSVADAACMARVAAILEDDPRPRVAAVLSACRGVTDALLGLVSAAERQEDGDSARLEAIRQRHVGIAHTLLGADDSADYVEVLGRDCHDIAGILQTVRLLRI